jgi:4-amino-4-deoxy-L-arabinose transferase-like glycosyltransferase
LAGAARIVLTAAFARELGANKFGTALAAALAATPAVWYVNDHQFAMNAFEPLFRTGCAFAVARMIHSNNPKGWIVFGTIAGLGLENKYSIAAFAFFLLAGLLLTPQRLNSSFLRGCWPADSWRHCSFSQTYCGISSIIGRFWS